MSISSSSDNIFVVVSDDILEQIFVRLDVEDLIRCKSVCKSWQSFISTSSFVNSHLNYSSKKDRNHVRYKYSHRRIVMSKFSSYNSNGITFSHESDDLFFNCYRCNLIGSSNGLVCISPSLSQVLVANPSTRQFILLQDLQIPSYFLIPKPYPRNIFSVTVHKDHLPPLCSGFGYDSSTDDYKLVFGFTKCIGKNLHVTCFQVLTMKSNVWKYIGQVKYTCVTCIGTFCNGAIHWVMIDQSDQTIKIPDKKKVIISFSLSNEEFKTTPTPSDVRLDSSFDVRLGVFDECLCIFPFTHARPLRWLMKTSSWLPLPFYGRSEFDTVHYLVEHHNWTPDKTITSYNKIWFSTLGAYMGAPIFVRSLVSPHHYFHNGGLKRKMPFEEAD